MTTLHQSNVDQFFFHTNAEVGAERTKPCKLEHLASCKRPQDRTKEIMVAAWSYRRQLSLLACTRTCDTWGNFNDAESDFTAYTSEATKTRPRSPSSNYKCSNNMEAILYTAGGHGGLSKGVALNWETEASSWDCSLDRRGPSLLRGRRPRGD